MTLHGRIEPLPDGTGSRVFLPDGRAIGIRGATRASCSGEGHFVAYVKWREILAAMSPE